MPRGGHAERALQASWWQEHGAAHAGGPRAQQAGKLETRALFAGSQGGTVAPAGGNTCAPLSARLDLKPPAGPAVGFGPHPEICSPLGRAERPTKKSPARRGAGVKEARVGLSRLLRSISSGWRAFNSATTPLVTPFWAHSALRTAAREEGMQRYLAFASFQLVTSLAVGRTIAHMTPPAAIPQITGADT
jgi:hypothetical protein